jgi:single-stranded-DNA-specific exonuclease
MNVRLPDQRWQIHPPQPDKALELSQTTGLLPITAQILINRGWEIPEAAHAYIEPEVTQLPPPLQEFPDLAKTVQILQEAITDEEKIIICGDYDADGMTSTALLLRALRHLGAEVDYAIPSRMKEGYGINTRIVEDCAKAGVGVILTVDNGISAYEPVLRAVELGLSVIITDHHEVPDKIPPADAILNPKLIPESSPYRGMAGVGVAYILAVTLAQAMDLLDGLTVQLLELFTLGTIADLAPLVGVNRRWLKRGLRRLPQSQLAGIQALMQMAGVSEEQKALKPDDIGFRLGPRINAVGRIADPQLVIELLTTDEEGLALERAMQCEQINRQRQELCEQIEYEANELIRTEQINWQERRVLVLLKSGWHHGVIGIVASRLVERYGVPVFICTYEGEGDQVRGSARGIPEFHVFEALNACQDLLAKYGGHTAAGGFSFPTENYVAFEQRLSEFAHQCLDPQHLKPLVTVDAELDFQQINFNLYQQLDSLHPWGIGNTEPVFWTPNVRILEQRVVGKNHVKLDLEQNGVKLSAIAWRWGEYFPLVSPVDLAYKISENHFNGNTTLQLEIIGARHPVNPLTPGAVKKATFVYQGRTYTCSLWDELNELRIKNDQGKVLAVTRGQKTGLLGVSRKEAQEVDVRQPPFYELIKNAVKVLDLG